MVVENNPAKDVAEKAADHDWIEAARYQNPCGKCGAPRSAVLRCRWLRDIRHYDHSKR
jgi:hypothetical protein